MRADRFRAGRSRRQSGAKRMDELIRRAVQQWYSNIDTAAEEAKLAVRKKRHPRQFKDTSLAESIRLSCREEMVAIVDDIIIDLRETDQQ
jgi:hypothetical protein